MMEYKKLTKAALIAIITVIILGMINKTYPHYPHDDLVFLLTILFITTSLFFNIILYSRNGVVINILIFPIIATISLSVSSKPGGEQGLEGIALISLLFLSISSTILGVIVRYIHKYFLRRKDI
jgi:hypothetical protein